jgi:hypothetical protein
MRLPTVLRTWLRPVIAPVRAAVDRRVTALVDARISELTNGRAPDRTEPPARLFDLVDERSHPNTNELWVLLRDLNNAKLTLKFFGYELGRRLSVALPPLTHLVPQHVGLESKPSTQADLESDWAGQSRD